MTQEEADRWFEILNTTLPRFPLPQSDGTERVVGTDEFMCMGAPLSSPTSMDFKHRFTRRYISLDLVGDEWHIRRVLGAKYDRAPYWDMTDAEFAAALATPPGKAIR